MARYASSGMTQENMRQTFEKLEQSNQELRKKKPNYKPGVRCVLFMLGLAWYMPLHADTRDSIGEHFARGNLYYKDALLYM